MDITHIEIFGEVKKATVALEKYILDENHNLIRCNDLKKWGEWHSDASNRAVAKTTINEVEVSTVFLGVNHNWNPGPLILFETMVFGGKLDEEQERCSTWDEALLQHKEMVEQVCAVEGNVTVGRCIIK